MPKRSLHASIALLPPFHSVTHTTIATSATYADNIHIYVLSVSVSCTRVRSVSSNYGRNVSCLYLQLLFGCSVNSLCSRAAVHSWVNIAHTLSPLLLSLDPYIIINISSSSATSSSYRFCYAAYNSRCAFGLGLLDSNIY